MSDDDQVDPNKACRIVMAGYIMYVF